MSTVSLVHCTPDAEKLIVKMARVSNPENQDNEETGPRLLRYLIKHRHWSPFEMASMCVKIETERDIAAQILRHRSFSFQEYCLAGSSKITIATASGGIQRIPIKILHQRWSSPAFRARFARAYDQQAERFILAPIKSVYASGEKPVYAFQIATAHSQRTIQCTREHRVLTRERGFVPFGDAFDNGLSVALNGQPAHPLPYQDPDVLRACAWMGSTRFAQEYGIADVTARKWFHRYGIIPFSFTHAGRSSVDASFSTRLASYMKWARSNLLQNACQECGHDGSVSRLELSHVIPHDGQPLLAFDDANLQTLCAKCHRRHDIDIQGKIFGWTTGMTAKWGRIVGQAYLGIQETFDIEMDHPTHNFVADGVVVHNSSRYSPMPPAEIPALRQQASTNRQSSVDELDRDVAKHFERMSASLIRNLHLTYQEMLEAGVARECARRILPLCTPTTLYMHGTLRSWVHYIELRTQPDTQLEHRIVAEQCGAIFAKQFPVIAEAAFASSVDAG